MTEKVAEQCQHPRTFRACARGKNRHLGGWYCLDCGKQLSSDEQMAKTFAKPMKSDRTRSSYTLAFESRYNDHTKGSVIGEKDIWRKVLITGATGS